MGRWHLRWIKKDVQITTPTPFLDHWMMPGNILSTNSKLPPRMWPGSTLLMRTTSPSVEFSSEKCWSKLREKDWWTTLLPMLSMPRIFCRSVHDWQKVGHGIFESYFKTFQERAVRQFGSADVEFGKMLRERIQFYKNSAKKNATQVGAHAHI